MKQLMNKLTTVILVLIMIVGLSLLLYPTVSDWVNKRNQSYAMRGYEETVSALSDEEYQAILDRALAFNQNILNREDLYVVSEEETREYEENLNLDGDGIMGSIDIPSIDVSIPIYHGVSEGTLMNSVGHLPWSALPVGGESTHCVLSGHTGLPSARLFTDLIKLVEGDTFMLRILNETYTYQVDQILVVLPEETDSLTITEGEDYCTLVTCTPYGVNSHRLLVRGTRIENQYEKIIVDNQAYITDMISRLPVAILPAVLWMLSFAFRGRRKRKERAFADEQKEQK